MVNFKAEAGKLMKGTTEVLLKLKQEEFSSLIKVFVSQKKLKLREVAV